MKEIDKYMTVGEAAERWGVKYDTLKQRLRPSKNKNLDNMIEQGLVKSYQAQGAKQKTWIISEDAMKFWYGEDKKTL